MVDGLTRRALIGAAAGTVLGVAGRASETRAASRYAATIGWASNLRLWGRTRRRAVVLPIPYVGANGQTCPPSLRAAERTGGLMVMPGSVPWGAPGVTVLHGCRTGAGGPMRYADKLVAGDRFTFEVDDFTIAYAVVDRRIAPSGTDEFGQGIPGLFTWDAGGRHGITLMTETKPDGRPTSTKYRMILRLAPA